MTKDLERVVRRVVDLQAGEVFVALIERLLHQVRLGESSLPWVSWNNAVTRRESVTS
ncbi:MAG: hypothetical protein WDN69_19315 [Aliidongia sp.]